MNYDDTHADHSRPRAPAARSPESARMRHLFRGVRAPADRSRHRRREKPLGRRVNERRLPHEAEAVNNFYVTDIRHFEGPNLPRPARQLGQGLFEKAVDRLGRELGSLDELQIALDTVTEDYNRTPQAELGGLAPLQVHQLLSADWETPAGALTLDATLGIGELAGARELANARIFLAALRDAGGARATSAGNLNRKFVAEMVEAMVWPPRFRDDLYEYKKVVNEEDAFPLHVLRLLLELARLVRRRKGVFGATRRGVELLADERAGDLSATLFRVQFREMNLAYLDRFAPEAPGLQHTIPFALYRFALVGEKWAKAERLVPKLMLPSVRREMTPSEHSDLAALVLSSRLLWPLERFGLAETREVRGKRPNFPDREYRKTPLYDRFLRFNLDSF